MRREGGVVAQFQASFKQEESILAAPVRVGLDALPLGSDTQGVIHHLPGFSSNTRAFKKISKKHNFLLGVSWSDHLSALTFVCP